MGLVLSILVVLVLIFLSALISGSEVSFFSLSAQNLEELSEIDERKEKQIRKLLKNPNKLLATILIANNFINVAIIILSSFLISKFFSFENGSTFQFVIQVIVITFILAAIVFVGVTIIGFIKHGVKYLELFVPKGVPIILLPLIIIIEIISYLSRPVSLSVRLFANMMAGHTMLKVFGGFIISLGLLGGWLPLGFSVALTGLEILVAFLQAYVFAILTCIYLNDALNLHH